MGFLKRFWRSVTPPACETYAPASSFDKLTPAQLNAHLHVDRYGDFLLTEAIRPSFDLKITPRAGYRHDRFHDEGMRQDIPVLAAAASRDDLFELFLDLLDPLGEQVDVVLESSHDPDVEGHVDMYRDDMDLVVLKSLLYDYEALVMKDGYTGLAVLRPDVPMEVQFDEHKLLFVYAKNIRPFERVLQRYGLERDDDLRLISEGEHLHLTEEPFADQFAEMKMRLGVED
jgi:hypothetical protein